MTLYKKVGKSTSDGIQRALLEADTATALNPFLTKKTLSTDNTVSVSNSSFSGTIFFLPSIPVSLLGVYVNGVFFTEDVDYTILNNKLTFLLEREEDLVTVVYKY